MHFLFFLFSIFCREKVAMENLYLTSPFVNGKGDSAVADFFGDFVIRSHGSKSQFIQLGYISPGSRGALQYKNKIEDDKFEIEVTVSVNDNNTIKSGQGLIIFISNSDQHEEGDFYGKGGSIDGLCICLDTSDYKNPFISAYSGHINTNDTKKVFKDKKYVDLEDNNKIKFRIVQDHRTLEVFVQDGHNELLVYSTRKNLVSKGSTLGMSASNIGSGQYSYMINSVEVGYLKNIKQSIEKGEREGSSKLVWIVFLFAFCGIGYYLYSVHKK
jgi:hypothetical protein